MSTVRAGITMGTVGVFPGLKEKSDVMLVIGYLKKIKPLDIAFSTLKHKKS